MTSAAVVESTADEAVLAQPHTDLRPPVVFGELVVISNQARQSVHRSTWREGTYIPER